MKMDSAERKEADTVEAISKPRGKDLKARKLAISVI